MQIRLACSPVPDRQRRPYGPFGVVLVRHGRAEECDDRVADELLHGSPEPLQLCPYARVIVGEQRAHVLRIHSLRLRGRADQIAEQRSDDLPFVPGRGTSASSERPHAPQKRKPSGFSCPQPDMSAHVKRMARARGAPDRYSRISMGCLTKYGVGNYYLEEAIVVTSVRSQSRLPGCMNRPAKSRCRPFPSAPMTPTLPWTRS